MLVKQVVSLLSFNLLGTIIQGELVDDHFIYKFIAHIIKSFSNWNEDIFFLFSHIESFIQSNDP